MTHKKLQVFIFVLQPHDDVLGLDRVAVLPQAAGNGDSFEVAAHRVGEVLGSVAGHNVDGRIVPHAVVVVGVKQDSDSAKLAGVAEKRAALATDFVSNPQPESVGSDGRAGVNIDAHLDFPRFQPQRFQIPQVSCATVVVGSEPHIRIGHNRVAAVLPEGDPDRVRMRNQGRVEGMVLNGQRLGSVFYELLRL